MHPLWHVQGKPSTCQRCEVWTKLILGCRADLLGRKRRGFSSQHSVSHPSLQKGPGTGTSHRNVLTDLKRLGIILCVLVSRKADSAFLLVLFKRVCGLAMCACGEVRMITDCSSISGAARGEEDADCAAVSLWIRKGKEAGCLKM